jgi:hypothetical protein
MDVPAVRQREGLVAVRLGAEACSDLVKGEAKPRGSGEGFEPSRGSVSLFNTPMVLLQMIVQVPVRGARTKRVKSSHRISTFPGAGESLSSSMIGGGTRSNRSSSWLKRLMCSVF